LLDINRKALELLDNTPPGETGDRAARQRVNVGVYLYQEDDGDNRADDGRGGGS
jgi:hypothetical protein